MPDEHERPSKFNQYTWDTLQTFFTSMFENVWKGFGGLWNDIVQELANARRHFWKLDEKTVWEALLQRAVEMEALGESEVQRLMKLRDLPWPFDLLAYVGVSFSIVFNILSQATSVSLAFAQRKQLDKFRPALPEMREVIPAAFIAPEKTAAVRKLMAESGLSDEHIDLWFISLYKLYDENMIKTLFHRGVLTKDTMFMRMRELGFTDTRIKELVQAWPVIPGPGELLHLVAKEAFEPDIISKMGLADEFPADQLKYMKAQGVTEEWALRFWYAHWEPPSIQQGYDMLHRQIPGTGGKKVIEQSDLELLYRMVEVPPFWRDKLTAVAFNPLTRVDIRRMHAVGMMDDRELQLAYEDVGFHPFNAEKMTEFTKRFNTDDDKQVTKGEILKGYREKLLEKDEAKALLRLVGFGDEIAEYLLLFEDYKDALDFQDELLKDIKTRYTELLINDAEARKRLDALNLPAKRKELLMERWQTQRFIDKKKPSRSDLDKFLKLSIITTDKYKVEMARLGYGSNYIEWYAESAAKTGAN